MSIEAPALLDEDENGRGARECRFSRLFERQRAKKWASPNDRTAQWELLGPVSRRLILRQERAQRKDAENEQ
jgi:hypothetical protein